MSDTRWIVSQIGSREHYAVPRAFEEIGKLRLLYTDAWSRGPMRFLKHGSASMRGLAGRFHPDIPAKKVVSFNVTAIRQAMRAALHTENQLAEGYLRFLEIGLQFDDAVVQHMKRSGLDSSRDAFFGYNTGSLHTLQYCKSQGVPTLLDQIDPARTEEEIVANEAEKWPGWQKIPGRVPQQYWDHMSAEWEAADVIVVNSNWSKNALISQGASPEKIAVIPLTYQANSPLTQIKKNVGDPLIILWLGSVILRKGIQYLIEAAKLLKGTSMRFVVAGPIGISEEAVSSAPTNISFVGRVTRDRTKALYQEADLFVLPTLSDGFAVTQLEAMSNGLPVVTTPNCGEVVTDGVDGLIVPPADGAALAAALTKLDGDRALLAEMSRRATDRSRDFLLPVQAIRIEQTLNEMR